MSNNQEPEQSVEEITPVMFWQIPEDDRQLYYKPNAIALDDNAFAKVFVQGGMGFNHKWQAQKEYLQRSATAAIRAAIERSHISQNVVIDWENYTQIKQTLLCQHLGDCYSISVAFHTDFYHNSRTDRYELIQMNFPPPVKIIQSGFQFRPIQELLCWSWQHEICFAS